MKHFLGFDFFIEQLKDGQWRGYGVNNKVKLPVVTAPKLSELESEFESQVIVYHCQADMGASWVWDKELKMIVYINIPCRKLTPEIARLDVDYNNAKTDIYDGIFDCKKAQYRVNVRPFKNVSLCKVIGIYAEPNLLTLNR